MNSAFQNMGQESATSPEPAGARQRLRRLLPSLLWVAVMITMFADIGHFNQRPEGFRIVCIVFLFGSPLVAVYTGTILTVFVRSRDRAGIVLSTLLLVPQIMASYVSLGWLIFGVAIQT